MNRLSENVCPSDLLDIKSWSGLTRGKWANTYETHEKERRHKRTGGSVEFGSRRSSPRCWLSQRLRGWPYYQKYKQHEEEEITWKNTFTRLDLLVAFMTLKNWEQIETKRDVKLEVQSKMFSCTPWQTYSKLFGMYDQQNVQFIISFLFFSSI